MMPIAVDTTAGQSAAVGPAVGFDVLTKPKKRPF